MSRREVPAPQAVEGDLKWRGVKLGELEDAALTEAYRLTSAMLRGQILEMQRRGMFLRKD